jgi:hypothetical protein
MDLLHITWRDAFDHDEVGWITKEQMDRLLSLDAVVESVGFKYHEDDKYITIVGDHEGDSFSRATRIPKGMIIKTIKHEQTTTQ